MRYCNLLLGVLSVMLVLFTATSAPLRHHRCIHDRIKLKSIPIVPQDTINVSSSKLDRDVKSGAAPSYANLRIKWFFNVDGKGACTKAGQIVTDYDGGKAKCTKDDVATPAKVAYWSKLLDGSASFFSRAMQIVPIQGPLVPRPRAGTSLQTALCPTQTL